MFRISSSRLIFFSSIAAIAAAAFVAACTDETTDTPSTPDASPDGSTPRRDGSGGDDDGDDDDAKDAGTTDAKEGKDANGPGEAGAECTFNRDCQAALRCECEDGLCECKPGPRGTGKNGVDPCTSGNDCESSVCIEADNGSYCSDECTSNADCTGNLPVCFEIIGLPVPICAPAGVDD